MSVQKNIKLDSTIQILPSEPTTELYASIQKSYDHFNQALFDGSLPKVIFTTQRKKNVMGYFSRERWVSIEGQRCHEIAINPSYVASSSLIELLQTLVHEMVHCWQDDFGKTGRRGYHNKEWADKMEFIGLMPSSTGRAGGDKTGDRMGDYPIPHGQFIHECKRLISTGFALPWIDRYTLKPEKSIENTFSPEIKALELDEALAEQLTEGVNKLLGDETFLPVTQSPKGRIKSRYSCPQCQLNVWGKPELDLSCNVCHKVLTELSGE